MQVYPSSFCDANGDGWGDIRGITSRVGYLKELGIDILWVSPSQPQSCNLADKSSIDLSKSTRALKKTWDMM